MKSLMFSPQHDYQIRRIVVELVSVYVVNLLDVFKRSAQHLLHDQPMFPDLLAVNRDQPIAVMINSPVPIETPAPIGVPVSPCPSRMTSTHAKRSSRSVTFFDRADQPRPLDSDGPRGCRITVTPPSFVMGPAHGPRFRRSVTVLDTANAHYPTQYGRP